MSSAADPNGDPTKGLLAWLVTNLVDDPGSVEIAEVSSDPSTVTYEVRVAQPDLGKVIGKQGRIANALRAVAKVAAGADKRRVFVDIVA